MANTKKKTTSSKTTKTKTSTAKKSTTKVSAKTTKAPAKKTTTKAATKKTTTKKVATKTTPKKVSQKVKKEKEVKKIDLPVEEERDDVEEIFVKKSKKKDNEVEKNDQNNSKLFTIIGISILVIAIVVSCVVTSPKGKYSDTKTTTNTSDYGEVVESDIPENERKELANINIDQYLEKLAGGEASVIYIGRPTCGHCVKQKPIMEHIVYKYGVTINYLNTDEMSDEDMNKLQESNELFSSGWGTPLTLIVKNNEVVDKASGETSLEDMVELFKQYGIINE